MADQACECRFSKWCAAALGCLGAILVISGCAPTQPMRVVARSDFEAAWSSSPVVGVRLVDSTFVKACGGYAKLQRVTVDGIFAVGTETQVLKHPGRRGSWVETNRRPWSGILSNFELRTQSPNFDFAATEEQTLHVDRRTTIDIDPRQLKRITSQDLPGLWLAGRRFRNFNDFNSSSSGGGDRQIVGPIAEKDIDEYYAEDLAEVRKIRFWDVHYTVVASMIAVGTVIALLVRR